jgi:hypothetical protein
VWIDSVTVWWDPLCFDKSGVVVMESPIKTYRWTEMPSDMLNGVTADGEAA